MRGRSRRSGLFCPKSALPSKADGSPAATPGYRDQPSLAAALRQTSVMPGCDAGPPHAGLVHWPLRWPVAPTASARKHEFAGTDCAASGVVPGRGFVMTRSHVVWCMCFMAGSQRSWKWCRVTDAGHVAGCGVTTFGLRPRRRENCHATRSCQSWSIGCQSPGSRPILEWPGTPHATQSWLPVMNYSSTVLAASMVSPHSGWMSTCGNTPELATRCVTVISRSDCDNGLL